MTGHWSLISTVLVGVAVVDILACAWVLSQRGAIGRGSVAVILAGAGTWCAAHALEIAASDLGDRQFWGACKYLGSTTIPPAWLLFVLRYTGRSRRPRFGLVGLLAVEPLIVLGLLAVPAARSLVRSYVPGALGDVPVVRLGPVYWAHFVYTNGLVIVASGVLIATLLRISPMYRRQTRALLATVILPLAGNVLGSFALRPFHWLDPTPVAVSLAGWALFWGAFRFRLLDLLPVARTTVFERITDGVLVLDGYHRIIDLNPAAQAVLGPAASVGRPLASVLPDQVAGLGTEPGVAEVQLGHGPAARHFQVTTSLLGRGYDGGAGHLLLLRDISERKEAEERLRWLANYDPLTRLPNRRLFADRLGQSLARARRHHLRGALVLLDLDGFKLINDSLGHQVGDQLLVAVAERLQRHLREQDTAARLGGDEFAVVLPEIAHSEDAAVVATKILGAVAQPLRVAGYDLAVTASIGVAVWPDDGSDQHILLSSADAALYQAKAHGKNRYELATPELGEMAGNRLRLATELRRALRDGGLRLLFQPYRDVATGDLVGMEALVRWTHPSRGLLAPAAFFPAAEEAGLTETIDRWVLAQACRHAETWATSAERQVAVAVNISPQRFADRIGVLHSEVESVLATSGLPPSRLTLELNERMVIENYQAALPELIALKRLGVALALDDFGAGYTSLSQLRRLPLDCLKIDKGLIAGLGTAPEDPRVVSAVIGLAHALELRVVAEGVERSEQLSLLRTLGCDAAQGFLLSRPLRPDAAARLASRAARGVSASVGGPRS